MLYNGKTFCSLSKNDREKFFFKQFFPNYIFRDVKCTFLEPAEKRLPEDRIVSCQEPQKIWKLQKNFQKTFSVEVRLRIRRIHIWQPHRTSFDKKPNFFRSMSEKRKETWDFFQTILRNCSCKHVECSLGSLAAFFDKKSKLFRSMSRVKKNLDSSFRQPCCKIIDWMPKKVCSVCENAKKYLIFFQKNYPKWSHRHVESSFHKPAKIFWQKA